MATIQTAEGDTLVVADHKDDRNLHVEARLEVGKSIVELEERLFTVYSLSADGYEARPRSRGDLTAEVVEDLVNRLIGFAVAEGRADRRSDVSVANISVEERSDAKSVSQPFVPDWEDDWPEDGSKSDQVRFLLDYGHASTDEDIAAGVGCSVSLVSDIKSEQE